MEGKMMRKNERQISIAKQLAKMLMLHRMWHGKNQQSIADIIGVTFQQYQKIEKCENRLFAHQLLDICKSNKWDIDLVANGDPYVTLDEWSRNRKRADVSGINNTDANILNKFNKIDERAYKNYFRLTQNNS
jgi:transcriptional regulator with XRE-family HTH domain